eukprot:gb/GECG01014533.1/.p1 GENE.gb/GECG01014533.1/~~gb/GECG01014533.1/.p1  ORF type:complete len:391 (+),score=24.16 gb/GECG01014533.1/:1-1173(+)
MDSGRTAFNLQQYGHALLQNARTTLWLVLGTLLSSLLALNSKAMANILALQPGHTLFGGHYLWNIVTSALVAPGYVWLIVFIPCILYLSYPCEKFLPKLVYAKWLWVSIAVNGLLTTILFSVYYVVTADEYYYFTNHGGIFSLVMTLSILATVADPTCQKNNIRVELPIPQGTEAPSEGDAELGQASQQTVSRPRILVISTRYCPLTIVALSVFDTLISDDLSNLVFMACAFVGTCLVLGFLPITSELEESLPDAVSNAFVVGRLFKPLVMLGKNISCVEEDEQPSGTKSAEAAASTAEPSTSSAPRYHNHYAKPNDKGSGKPAAAAASDPLADRRRARALRLLDKKLSGLGSQTSAGVPKSKESGGKADSSADSQGASTREHAEDADET